MESDVIFWGDNLSNEFPMSHSIMKWQEEN